MPLRILIAGASIAGLATALSLRRAGHAVQVYERASAANDRGAAIHVCSNAARPLRAWSFGQARAGFVEAGKTVLARGESLGRV